MGLYIVTTKSVLQSLICLFFILVSTNVGKYNLQDQLGLLVIGWIIGEFRLKITHIPIFNFASLPLSFTPFFPTDV